MLHQHLIETYVSLLRSIVTFVAIYNPWLTNLKEESYLEKKYLGFASEVFKVRVRNSDVQKGKSGGYRLIYYLKTETSVILLTIYTKSEQADVAADIVRGIIAEYEQRPVENEEEA